MMPVLEFYINTMMLYVYIFDSPMLYVSVVPFLLLSSFPLYEYSIIYYLLLMDIFEYISFETYCLVSHLWEENFINVLGYLRNLVKY